MRSWPVVVVVVAVVAVLGGCRMCERYRYTEGVSLPTGAASVPLNQAWEHVLEIYSGGTWGPVPPHGVVASTDPTACRALVFPRIADGDDMRLVVIGAKPGRCTVDLEYLDPHEKRWKTSIAIDFTPAESLPVLAVGAPIVTPSMFGDARCDRDVDGKVRCFPKDTYGADERHASCAWTSRCSSSRGGPQGFELCASKGTVTGTSADGGGCAP